MTGTTALLYGSGYIVYRSSHSANESAADTMQAMMVVAPTIATTIAIIQRRLSLIFCLFIST